MNIYIQNNLRLENIPDILRQLLIQKLTLTNPKWLENQRMGRWNHKTPKELTFYTKADGGSGLRIPRGYMRQLIQLCRTHDISYTIDDKRRMLPEQEFEFKGQLKSFQQEAADRMLSKEFGILNAATGAGKTIIALYMIARRKQPSLIVVHTKDLAGQWMERIHDFLGIPAEKIGYIGGGKRNVGTAVTVAMVQTLYKYAHEVAPQIGFIIVDECHRCPSRTFTEAVVQFDSRYMLGLSATPWRRDKLSKLIFWHLGDVHHEIDKQNLVEKGHILHADAIFRETTFVSFVDPVNYYSKMLSELTGDQERNFLIASDVAVVVKNNPGICLVLSDRKSHCENLAMLLKYKFTIEADVLTGDIPVSERQIVVDRLNTGEVTVLIATGQLIGEGFDCPGLTNLFLATPLRFSGRVLQYIGRVLRPAEGKERARIFDYVDVKVGVLQAAANARHRIYVEQGIDVESNGIV